MMDAGRASCFSSARAGVPVFSVLPLRSSKSARASHRGQCCAGRVHKRAVGQMTNDGTPILPDQPIGAAGFDAVDFSIMPHHPPALTSLCPMRRKWRREVSLWDKCHTVVMFTDYEFKLKVAVFIGFTCSSLFEPNRSIPMCMTAVDKSCTIKMLVVAVNTCFSVYLIDTSWPEIDWTLKWQIIISYYYVCVCTPKKI